MIGTKLVKGQGLGNQLFCFISAKCIAAKRNEEFGLLGAELFPNQGEEKLGLYFMEMDLGKAVTEDDFTHVYEEKETRLFLGNSIHDITHGCYVSAADEEMEQVLSNTLLQGNMQAAAYLQGYKEEIKQWLQVKPAYDSYEYYKENLCVLNFRGGEYTGSVALYLRKKYWLDAMKNMKKICSDMEFMIVTDDVEAANKMLPEIPAYHFTLDKDYVTVKNGKYLILSNSSFAFFPAYTSETAVKIIAPKYWARHNVSDGYWSSEQNIYDEFVYQDRKGKLFSAVECRAELETYKNTKKTYKVAQNRATGIKAICQKIKIKYIIYSDLACRIPSAIKRRMKL
ncbi:MAG: glycosyl transferase [Eubacteriales bacterium]